MEAVDIPRDILNVLENAVEGQLADYSIVPQPRNEKGQGFLSDLLYLTLRNKHTDSELHLVIKQANSNGKFVECCFKQEIYFYESVWPKLMELEQNQPQSLKPVPNCLAVDSRSEKKKIVFENLKIAKFELTDLTKPFDKRHVELVFRSYGKFHGLNFVFKHQNPEEYSRLLNKVREINSESLKLLGFMYRRRAKFLERVRDLFKDSEHKRILQKLNHYVENEVYPLWDSQNYKGPNTIILHGDCWSSNYMFRYDESSIPVDMKILDFQLSFTGTPVFDLSYSLYCGGCKEIWDDLDHYLVVYYESLSSTIRSFGIDAEVLYPFSVLKEDWKNYSKYGFMSGLFMWAAKLIISIKDIPTIDDLEKEVVLLEDMEIDEEQYKKLATDMVWHMYKNDFL